MTTNADNQQPDELLLKILNNYTDALNRISLEQINVDDFDKHFKSIQAETVRTIAQHYQKKPVASEQPNEGQVLKGDDMNVHLLPEQPHNDWEKMSQEEREAFASQGLENPLELVGGTSNYSINGKPIPTNQANQDELDEILTGYLEWHSENEPGLDTDIAWNLYWDKHDKKIAKLKQRLFAWRDSHTEKKVREAYRKGLQRAKVFIHSDEGGMDGRVAIEQIDAELAQLENKEKK